VQRRVADLPAADQLFSPGPRSRDSCSRSG
jgi:hypothetical protein